MKTKHILIVAVIAILLAGCAVKSLKPFYTKDTLAYDTNLLGEWQDGKGKKWGVLSMKEELKKDTFFTGKSINTKEIENTIKEVGKDFDSVKVNAKVTKSKKMTMTFENKELEDIYRNAYIMIYKSSESKEGERFVVVPFQVQGQVFLDFCPLYYAGIEGLSEFSGMHYVGIHTLAKLDRVGEELQLSWLSESRISELFEQNKIRIAHEKTGIYKEEILLTASSEELQKFIAKYMNLENEKKWQTTVKLTLKRTK